MQERGVSKRVSVKLEQVSADGSIDADTDDEHDDLDETDEIAPTTSNGKANQSNPESKAEETRESIIEAKPLAEQPTTPISSETAARDQ